MRCLLAVLAVPVSFACAAPSKATPPERQKVTNQDRQSEQSEDEPLHAPPPGYGNKVVQDEHARPERQARDDAGDCRVPRAEDTEDGPVEAECAPASTTTVY